MAGKIQAEIKQAKPFPAIEEEVFLNLQRTADRLMAGLAGALKPADLSPTQYNVLRILRGAGGDGLACGEIAERMVTRDPDMTRLLDRLEKRALVSRSRESKDRRVITVRITGEGEDLLKSLDQAVGQLHRLQLGHLGPRRIRELIEVLEVARERAG